MRNNTLVISRMNLKKILLAYGLSDKKMNEIISGMEKGHRHINIVQFIFMLEKAGVQTDKMANLFRRLNMDDVQINEVLDMADDSKISAETGRLYNAVIEIG